MQYHNRRCLTLILGIVGALALTPALMSGARAQDYPVRPIKIVVPYSPGGSTDILTRLLAQRLTARIGQTVLVENRPGANGRIGTEAVARAPADGYTLLMVTNGQTINAGLYPDTAVDLERDFLPVVNVAAMPNLILAHPSQPFKTLRELIDAAKAKPGSLSYSHAGIGSPQHLTGELFKLVAKVDIVGVPYKGGGPAIADAVAGQVQVVVAGIPAVSQHVASGRLRALAVTSVRRSALLPELSTVAENGYTDFDAIFWIAILAPRGVPAAIVQRLNADANTALRESDIERQFALQGATATGGSPTDLGAYMRKDIETWKRVIKEANIKPEN